MQILKRHLVYAGLDKDTFDDVKQDWLTENRFTLLIYSAISFIAFFVLNVANLFTEDVTSVNAGAYGYMLLIEAIIFLMTLIPARKYSKLTIPLAYVFLVTLHFFTINLTALHLDMPAVTAVAILFLAPYLFTDRPIRMMSATVAAVVFICLLSFRLKEPDIARLDMWNSITIGFITLVIEYLQMHVKFASYAKGREIRYLSETDVLTGCRNRNLYEKRLDQKRPVDRTVVIYVDVNGLHELNNTRGHLAGDIMLKTVASQLISSFQQKNVYRIGGDEFVVLLEDASEKYANDRMSRISQALEEQDYHVSVGVASHGESMTELVQSAEVRMYKSKRAFYQERGIERRRYRGADAREKIHLQS